jgi:hypothetical protein
MTELSAMCPTAGDLTVAAGGVGLAMAMLAGLIGHGILRPLLEARGVAPWTLRDSLGSTPLILIGSFVLGAATAFFLAHGITKCTIGVPIMALLSASIVISVLVVRLGLIALRKLV